MTLKRAMIFIGIGFALLWMTLPTFAVEADGTLVAASILGDFGGLNVDTVEQKFKGLFDIIGQKTNKKFKFMVLSDSDLMKAFKSKKIDIVFSGLIYEIAKSQGMDPLPVAVIAPKGNIKQKVCLYTAPNSSYKTVKDLKGTVMFGIMGGGTSYYLLRKLLYDGGVNEPPAEFFKTIKALPENTKQAFEDVAAGQGSSVMMLDTYKTYFANDKLISGFKEFACSPPFTESFFMVQRNFDKSLLEQLKTILLNADKDPAFAAFRFIFIALNAKMKLVTEKDYAPNLVLYKEAQQKGWVDEIKKYNLPVERKK